jgi:alkyl hydroperoxide reductase subunit AhpC
MTCLKNLTRAFALQMGPIKWHEWIDGSWAILFSHPADFTPVCTTEIGRMALKYKYLADKGCKVAALSCNALGEHNAWWVAGRQEGLVEGGGAWSSPCALLHHV